MAFARNAPSIEEKIIDSRKELEAFLYLNEENKTNNDEEQK
jgi:hypothetical protein